MTELGMVWTWIAIGILAAYPLSILYFHWKVEALSDELAATVAAVQKLGCVPEDEAVKDAQLNGGKLYSIDLAFGRIPLQQSALRVEPDTASEETEPTDVIWNGDKVYYTDVPAEEVEHRIREALNLQRLERSSKHDVLNVA